MKTLLYNPIFINPQAYYVFPRLTRYLQPDNESTSEPANYIGTIEVKVIAYGDTTLKRTYTNTDSIYLSEFKNTWIRISLFTKVGSCVLGEWKIGNMESDLPYIDPEVLASLKAVVIVGNKTNNDSDRAIVKNLVDPDNPFVISNAAFKLNSGFGKYEITFQYFPYIENVTNVSDSKVVFGIGGQLLIPYPAMTENIPSFKIKVNGLSGTYHFRYYYRSSDGVQHSVDMAQDGYYELPICYNVQSSSDGTNCGFGNPGMGNSVTITQIPSHAGALCLDGVNDFGKVTGMPIYKDYTVIADYIRTSAKENAQDSPILSKSQVVNNGAFVFNYLNINSALNSYSFGTNNGLESISDSERKIYYQSKYVNDGKSINSGTGIDYNSMWLGTYRDNVQIFFNGAIYSLMSFPYSMSEFLIERQLKKHKLGTLYPNMVEFRPVIKANANYKITYYQIDSTNTWKSIKVGDYIVIGAKLAFQITFDNDASELKEVVSPQLSGIIVEKRPSNPGYNIYSYITSKSPQKINITIDEYIRYEDIVQPYPVLLRFNDENGNEISWGGKFRVGSTITRIGSFYENNLIDGLYIVRNPKLNGNNLITPTHVVEKSMVFTCDTEYLLDNNEPKCILSPSRLRIPNSSYKLLGYIPDISGHGNHGIINNSAYAEGSGVNADGSYQFDGVDDFVTIPTVTGGGKQVLMKVNNNTINSMLYDQRSSNASPNSLNSDFAIYTTNTANDNLIAYQARLVGNTYIDGILNTNITCEDLLGVLHNITITCDIVVPNNGVVPSIGRGGVLKNLYSNMALYDFMLFDEISTDDKILELNEYVGIEGNTE